MGAPNVTYQMMPETYSVSANTQGLRASCQFLTEWSDAYTFVNQALGMPNGAAWANPSSPNMFAVEATIRPVGLTSNLTSANGTFGLAPGQFFEKAKIELVFSTPDNNLGQYNRTDTEVDTTELMTSEVQIGVQTVNVPVGSMEWHTTEAGGAAQSVNLNTEGQPEKLTILIPTANVNVTVHGIKDNSWVAASRLVGKTNNATLWGYSPETLLLTGVTTRKRVVASGLMTVDATLNYKWMSVGWNTKLSRNGSWRRIKFKSGALPYPTGNITIAAIFPNTSRILSLT
jgi:hypothetical protein